MNKKVEYVLIANIDKNIIIGSYPNKSNYENEAKDIYNDFLALTNKQQKFYYQKDNYHYYLSTKNIFYCVYSPSDVDDSFPNDFILELETNNISLLIDESSNKLNTVGKKELAKLFNDFNEQKTERKSKVNDINIELKQTKDIMKKNIEGMVQNVDSMKDIEEKSVQIKSSSEEFKSKAKDLSFKAMWENNKIKMLFICFVVLIVIILIIYLCCKKGDKDKEKNI